MTGKVNKKGEYLIKVDKDTHTEFFNAKGKFVAKHNYEPSISEFLRLAVMTLRQRERI